MRTEADQDSSRPVAHIARVSCETCVAKHGRPRLPIFSQDTGSGRQAPESVYPALLPGYALHSLGSRSQPACRDSHNPCQGRCAVLLQAAAPRCHPTRLEPASCHAHSPERRSQTAERLSCLQAGSSWFRAYRGLLGCCRPLCRWPLFYDTWRFAQSGIQRLPVPLDAAQSIISLKKHHPELGKDSIPDPFRKAQMAGRAGAELLRHVFPRATASEHVQDAIQHKSVGYTRPSSRAFRRLSRWQERLKLSPQIIANVPDRRHSFLFRFGGSFFHTASLPTIIGF